MRVVVLTAILCNNQCNNAWQGVPMQQRSCEAAQTSAAVRLATTASMESRGAANLLHRPRRASGGAGGGAVLDRRAEGA